MNNLLLAWYVAFSLSWLPSERLVYGQGNKFCESSKDLKDNDTDYSLRHCFNLQIVAQFNPQKLEDFQEAFLIFNQSLSSVRCSMYEVENIDIIILAYNGSRNLNDTRQPVGVFNVTDVQVENKEPEDAGCSDADIIKARAMLKTKHKGRSFSNAPPITGIFRPTSRKCTFKPPNNNTLYEGGEPEMLSIKTIMPYQPTDGIWALWSFNSTLTNPNDTLILNFIAEVSYKNKIQKRIRKKIIGLLGTSYMSSGSIGFNPCKRFSVHPDSKLLIPRKMTEYSNPLSLCRCLKDVNRPITPKNSLTTGAINTVADCIDLSFNPDTFCAVLEYPSKICSTKVKINKIHEVWFSSYNDKGFPYGRWEPVVDGWSICNATTNSVALNGYSNHYWKSEKCFYDLEKPETFYNSVFGETKKNNFPTILHLTERSGNPQIFQGRFIRTVKGLPPFPSYFPKTIQIRSDFLVSGEISGNTSTTSFVQIISKYKEYTLDPMQVEEISAPSNGIQLNEEYYDEVNFIFNDKGQVGNLSHTMYTCTSLKAPKNHLCTCFNKIRNIVNSQELEDLVIQNPKLYLEDKTKERCFDLQAEFNSNLTSNKAGQQAIVAFRHRCPTNLEVIETVIEALSHNGLPLATGWKEVKLGINSDPDDPEQKWQLDTCFKLVGDDAIIRETWTPVARECDTVEGSLRQQQLISSDPNQKSFLFHFNRPITGSKKGSELVKDNIYSFCAVFEWVTGQFEAPRQKYFELQFVAQGIIENLSAGGKHTAVTVRSPRFGVAPSNGDDQFPNPVPLSVPTPAIRTLEIDLNSEYHDQIIYGKNGNPCLNKPPVFDEFNDELCTCFFDHSGREAPDNPDEDVLLEHQAQTTITAFSQGEPWKFVVKINIEKQLNVKYGINELVLQTLTPINGDVRNSMPVGKWGSELYVGQEDDCFAGNIKDGVVLLPQCHVSNSARHFQMISSHSSTNPPTIFHFQNPWLDDYYHLCVEWQFSPTAEDDLNGISKQYFQFYSQIIYEERPKPGVSRSKKNRYSTPIHGRQNYKFKKGGLGIEIIEKPHYQHDDDFRLSLHPDYKNAERTTFCGTQGGGPDQLPLSQLPPFDSTTCIRFHPFPFVTRIDIDDQGVDPIYKTCFSLDAFPLKSRSNLHVRFRQYDKVPGNNPKCEKFRATEILLQALDQFGNPVGENTESFSSYDEGVHLNGGNEERCINEDVAKRGTAFNYRKNHACIKYVRVPNRDNFIAYTTNHPYRPSVYHATFHSFLDAEGGTCFTWGFNDAEYRKLLGIKLTQIQFIAEVFVPDGPSRKEGKLFVVRSPKYNLNVQGTVPQNIPQCHNESLLSPTSRINKVEKPTTQSDIDIYNIVLNQDQYRASVHFKYSDTTHEPPPEPVTNPPVTLNVTTHRPDPNGRTTERHDGNIPEKIFHGCLTTKGCFTPEEYHRISVDTSCVEMVNCEHLVAYGKSEDEDNEDDEIVMELYSHTLGWIAVAFSLDDHMGQDYVVECVRGKINFASRFAPVPNLYHSWNEPTTKNNRRITNETSNIRIKETLQSKESIYCKFYIKKRFLIADPFRNEKHQYDLDKKYCLLTAWSGIVRKHGIDGNIGIHSPNSGYPCDKMLRVSRQFTPTSTQVHYLQVHGAFMTIAWVFFMPVGNFIGRYFKEILTKPSFFQMKLWRLLHVVFALLALICMIMGVGFQIAGMKGWESLVGKNWFHAFTGYFIITLFIVNCTSGFYLRPYEPDHHVSFMHMIVAYVIQMLSFAIIAEAHKIPFSSVSCVLGYMGIIWTFLYVILNILMSYHNFWIPCIFGNADASVPNALNQSRAHQEWQVEQAGGNVRIRALLVFAGIAFLFTIAISGIIILPPVGPCYVEERFLYSEN